MFAARSVFRIMATIALASGSAAIIAVPAVAQSHGGGFHGGGGGGFHGGGGGSFHGGGGSFHGGGGGFHGGDGYRGYGYRGGYGYGGFRGGFGFGYGCCYGGYYGGFGFGDALLGAAVIGGTAAIIASNEPDYYAYPAPVYPAYPVPAPAYGYASPPTGSPPPQQQAYQPTDPVEQCTRAAVNEAAQRGDSGHITKIDRVDGEPNGARVTGTFEVRRDSHKGEIETARFSCTAAFGQVTSFRFG